jgi:hypothetical protein
MSFFRMGQTLVLISYNHITHNNWFWNPYCVVFFSYLSSNQDTTVGDVPEWATLERLQTSRSAPGMENRCTEMLQCRVYSERYTSAVIHITNIISKAAP